MSVALLSGSSAATARAGELLAGLLAAGDCIVLAGDLGAGKTALVKGVGVGLGVVEPIVSPTFNILLVHAGRLELDHFDLYRLEHADELDDIDFWGTLESGGVSFIEWGERFAPLMPADRLDVTITIDGESSRRIGVEGRGARGGALEDAWAEAWAAEGGEVAR